MFRPLLSALALSALALPALAEIASTVAPADLSEGKRTSLGLYLTPADAAAALEAEPGIVFIDVRDPIEINFVGHPAPIDAIVPFETATLDFDEKAGGYGMAANPAFVAQVAAVMDREGRGKDDPVFVICRSGGRSADAVEALAAAGYTNVWNLVEGFEGDKDDAGARAVNGWRRAGLPWSYRIEPAAAWQPAE